MSADKVGLDGGKVALVALLISQVGKVSTALSGAPDEGVSKEELTELIFRWQDRRSNVFDFAHDKAPTTAQIIEHKVIGICTKELREIADLVPDEKTKLEKVKPVIVPVITLALGALVAYLLTVLGIW